jgi:adenosylcobinamide-GDP ribazoletransferase
VPLLAELATCLRFFSRLPVPGGQAMGAPGPALVDSLRLLPLAGLLIGACTALPLAVAQAIGLPPALSATLGLLAGTLATGALHEDGLADTADGFGGGDSREQKLAIMRDSRIGTYGVCALILSLVLRAGALASLAEPGLVAAALIASHAAARAIVPAVMFFLGPARTDGLSFSAGAPSIERPGAALAIAVVVLLLTLGFVMTVETLIALAIVGVAMTRLSERQIGGQTGDVLGGAEQVAETAILVLLAARLG